MKVKLFYSYSHSDKKLSKEYGNTSLSIRKRSNH